MTTRRSFAGSPGPSFSDIEMEIVQLVAAAASQITDGRITKARGLEDTLRRKRQLGLLPAPV